MAQVNMPSRAPTQLEALATALDIGKTLYGISSQREQLELQRADEQRKIAAANQESQIKGYQISSLEDEMQRQKKQQAIDERLAKGDFQSPMELLAFKQKNKLDISDKPTQFKGTFAGKEIFFKPKSDIEEQLTLAKIGHEIAGTEKTKKETSQIGVLNRLQEEQILTSQANRAKTLAEASKIASENLSGKQLTPTEIDKHAEGAAIPQLLGELKQSILDNKSVFGPFAGLSKFNPYSEQAVTLQSQFKTASQIVGKYMEGGVLRKEDELKYEKMLPQITDTPQVAMNKLNIVTKMLIDKYDSNLNSLKNNGFNVSGMPRFSSPKFPDVIRKNQNIIENAFAGDQKVPLFNPNKKFNEVK